MKSPPKQPCTFLGQVASDELRQLKRMDRNIVQSTSFDIKTIRIQIKTNIELLRTSSSALCEQFSGQSQRKHGRL